MRIITKTALLAFMLPFLLGGFGTASGQESAAPEEVKTAAGIKIETVETDTFAMDYFKFGHGEKTFVILPGLSVQSVMGSADAVADAYKQLTDDFTVYVFDRRKELPESYSIYEMARDTADAFQALGLKQISLFGASQGGMMAMEIAISYPELVEALVLGSTSARISEEQYQNIETWITLARENKAEELYLAFGEMVYPPAAFEQLRQLFIDAAKTVTDKDLKRFVIMSEGLKGFDVTENLDKISCPVLVLGDTDDHVLGGAASEEIGEYLKDRPDCELYMYSGYGHAAYDTAPDYRERILVFLKNHI